MLTFEFHVGFESQRCAAQDVTEAVDGFRWVMPGEFLGHEGGAALPAGDEGFENLEDGGDSGGQGEVHRFDGGPGGEGPVGDDQGVGVADAGDERQDVGVDDSAGEHGWKGQGVEVAGEFRKREAGGRVSRRRTRRGRVGEWTEGWRTG